MPVDAGQKRVVRKAMRRFNRSVVDFVDVMATAAEDLEAQNQDMREALLVVRDTKIDDAQSWADYMQALARLTLERVGE